MTQQVFADYIGLAPATLSSIFNGRTRPTLNVVEALKKKIPNISIDWLMFGSGEMYLKAFLISHRCLILNRIPLIHLKIWVSWLKIMQLSKIHD